TARPHPARKRESPAPEQPIGHTPRAVRHRRARWQSGHRAGEREKREDGSSETWRRLMRRERPRAQRSPDEAKHRPRPLGHERKRKEPFDSIPLDFGLTPEAARNLGSADIREPRAGVAEAPRSEQAKEDRLAAARALHGTEIA